MLEEKQPFGILRMDHGWTREQKRKVDAIIIKHNLQAFRYRPTLQMLISEGEQISFVAGYPVDRSGRMALLVSDLVEGPACAFDLKTSEPAPQRHAPAEFDVHIWGSRFDDTHWSTPSVLPQAGWTIGDKEFVAPLADWTRAEVLSELAVRGISPDEAIVGDFECCSRCLIGTGSVFCPKEQKDIKRKNWDLSANLGLFERILTQE